MSGFHSFARVRSHRHLFSSVLILIAALTVASAASASDLVTKILVDDNTWSEISNTGTLNAANRLVESAALPLHAKTQALGHVFDGAFASGKLVPTSLVAGDQFFALDGATGEVVVVEYTGTTFLLPTGTSVFDRWQLPGGVH